MTILGIGSGDIQVGLALFFIPYLYGSSALGALAILTVFAGLLVLVLDRLPSGIHSGQEGTASSIPVGRDDRKKGFGGVVLVGPVPIVFGSSDRAALWALIAAACLVMILMAAFLLL